MPTAARGRRRRSRRSDHGHFWVGIERRKNPYGTIVAGQMYARASDAGRRASSLSRGAGARRRRADAALHGIGRRAGGLGALLFAGRISACIWWIGPAMGARRIIRMRSDRSERSRSYEVIVPEFRRSANGPNPVDGNRRDRRSGHGSVDGRPERRASGQCLAHKLWASGGAELLDRIGPAIVQVHSAGGPFSWLVANERPKLVKAIVNVEGAGAPFSPQTPWGLTDVPLAYDPPVKDPANSPRRTSRAARVLRRTSCRPKVAFGS